MIFPSSWISLPKFTMKNPSFSNLTNIVSLKLVEMEVILHHIKINHSKLPYRFYKNKKKLQMNKLYSWLILIKVYNSHKYNYSIFNK